MCPGVDLEGGAIGGEGLVDATGSLHGDAQVEAWVGVAGHHLACPLELTCGLVEQVLGEVQHAEVVVGGAVVEIERQRIAEERLGSLGVAGHEFGGLGVEALGLEWVAIVLAERRVGTSAMRRAGGEIGGAGESQERQDQSRGHGVLLKEVVGVVAAEST